MKKLITETLKVAQVNADDFAEELVDLIRKEAEFRDTDEELNEFMISGGTLIQMLEVDDTTKGKYLKNHRAVVEELVKQTTKFQYVMFTSI